MAGKNAHQEQQPSYSSQQGLLEITDFPTGAGKNRYASHFVNIDRRSLSNTVFHIDDNTFTSSLPRASHWSIAWSDLMMTMFVLFLSMFAYQAAHEDFLGKKTPEVIGGDTTEALQTTDSSGASFPFAPISPGLPLITGGTVKKVEKVAIDSLDPDTVYQAETTPRLAETEPELTPEAVSSTTTTVEQQEDIIPSNVPPMLGSAPDTLAPTAASPDAIVQSDQPEIEEPRTEVPHRFQEIYSLSQDALKSNSLDKFAAIDIIPDKTMRIILTGDLLFAVGESELSDQARTSLQKVARGYAAYSLYDQRRRPHRQSPDAFNPV